MSASTTKNGLDFLDNTPTQQIIAVAKNVASIRAEYAQRVVATVTACIKAAKTMSLNLRYKWYLTRSVYLHNTTRR